MVDNHLEVNEFLNTFADKNKIMIYLEKFRFPSREKEEDYVSSLNESYYNKTWEAMYPFYVLSEHNFMSLDFEPITILYGGNGSGKSTALNIMSNALHVKRNSPYNNTLYMDAYIKLCSFKTDIRWSGEEFNMTGQRQSRYDIAEITQMITSDDIFKMIFDNRIQNEQRIHKSKILSAEIRAVGMMDSHSPEVQRIKKLYPDTGENMDEYKRYREMKKARSFSSYLTQKLGPIERGFSNGENGMMYLAELIQQEGLYLLDEPENSMSPKMQLDLKRMLEEFSHYCGCQFIIATHSPFLLAMEGARIYDLDSNPVQIRNWWELENVRIYRDFFEEYSDLFQ